MYILISVRGAPMKRSPPRRHNKPGRMSVHTLTRRAAMAAHPFVAGSVSAMIQSR
jgi:hypothetical protein